MQGRITRREFIKAGAAGLGVVALEGFAGTPLPEGPAPFSRMGFGSCLGQPSDAKVLSRVVDSGKPDAFVWLGDNIYADTQDMTVKQAQYDILGANPNFQKLWKACPNFAAWDDHDYGADNMGQEYPMKRQSQALFLDFWKVPADDPRRTREGIYHSRIFGEGARTVQLIQLDNRYFRSTRKGDPGTMLGTAQWNWLAEELKKPATLRVITSGIQVLPDEHGWEGWHEFPAEKKKLFDLIRNGRTQGVVFASGDQHWAEVSRLEGALGYPAYELTASGLDKYWDLPVNRLRVGKGNPDWHLESWKVGEPLLPAPDPGIRLHRYLA